jgi:hypothetical protein
LLGFWYASLWLAKRETTEQKGERRKKESPFSGKELDSISNSLHLINFVPNIIIALSKSLNYIELQS